MSKQFRFDQEVDLDVPPGCFPIVEVEITPKNGTARLFGYLRDARFTDIAVRGSKDGLELPFNRPKLFIQKGSAKTIHVRAVGWVEPKWPPER